MPPSPTRRARLWRAAESNNVPLRAILVTVAVVVAAFLAGKIVDRLRGVILLLVVAGFIALLLNPLVVALHRWLGRRGIAVAVVTLLAVCAFAGLAVAFGYPLVNGISHFADDLPLYVSNAQHGRGWIGHLVTKYHLQEWVVQNAPKLASYGRDLAHPALSLGKGALSLVFSLFTIFVLVVLVLLEAPKLRAGVLGMMVPDRAERYTKVAREVNRSVVGYMLGNFATSVIAGVVVLATLLLLRVPFPFLWALWVALVDFLPMIGGALAGIPVVLFAFTQLGVGRDRDSRCLPRLHPGREPRSEPGHHEPHGPDQSAARPRRDPGRRVHRQLDRWLLRRVRRGPAGDSGGRRDPGGDEDGLAVDGASARCRPWRRRARSGRGWRAWPGQAGDARH